MTPIEREHAEPGRRERVFHMLVRDGDVYSPSNYIAVPAVLRGVGRRIQVYVAREDLDSVGAEAVSDIINTFDNRIFPLDVELDSDRRRTSMATDGSRCCSRAGSITWEGAVLPSTDLSEWPIWTGRFARHWEISAT